MSVFVHSSYPVLLLKNQDQGSQGDALVQRQNAGALGDEDILVEFVGFGFVRNSCDLVVRSEVFVSANGL